LDSFACSIAERNSSHGAYACPISNVASSIFLSAFSRSISALSVAMYRKYYLPAAHKGSGLFLCLQQLPCLDFLDDANYFAQILNTALKAR